jgi:hypothetical protein
VLILTKEADTEDVNLAFKQAEQIRAALLK